MRNFQLSDVVNIAKTGQPGTIEAICIYNKGMPNQYLVEFRNGMGDLASMWLSAEDIYGVL